MSATNYIEKNGPIIEQCKQGNRQAQYKLYQLYARAMYNVCYRILAHEAEAEDTLQEAFIDAFAKLHTYRHEASFGAWLKRIVVNKAINQLRNRRIAWLPLDEPNIQTHVQTVAWTEESEGTSDFRVEEIVKGVEQLPEGYRVVLSLYLFEGYDHQEISQILGISEVTSRTQYSRGKTRLMQLLQNK